VRSTPKARSSASPGRSLGSPTGRTPGARTCQPSPARPSDFDARADFTSELAENNPDWKLDLNDDVIGIWRGEQGRTADVTLVWGVPLLPGGAIVTGELANLAVDQCELVDERFTLIAADNYRSDYLEVKLWGKRGEELAAESLYVDDDSEAEHEGEEEDT
jgi:hypothetical protein